MNSKKIITLVAAAVTVLAFAGCQEAQQPQQSYVPTSGNNVPAQNVSLSINPAEQGASTLQTITPATGSQETTAIPSPAFSAADQLAKSVAVRSRSESKCLEIKDQDLQTQCSADVKNAIIMDGALNKQDATLCQKLSTDDLRKQCESQITSATQQQMSTAQLDAEAKLRDQIIAGGDYKRCGELKVLGYISDCEIDILSKKALDTKDSTWCDKASTDEIKQQCMVISQKSSST